jgi:hypothetical protein
LSGNGFFHARRLMTPSARSENRGDDLSEAAGIGGHRAFRRRIGKARQDYWSHTKVPRD